MKDGLWRLSPSALYKYTECRSCFWVDNHYKRPPMLPLLLNSAMDSVLKARYDKYRTGGAFPPEARELEREGIRPFADLDQLNDWRENISALEVVNEEAGYRLVGKIDDVLVETSGPAGSAGGRLVPADYKSSGNAPAEDKQKYYVDQLAAYGLMFRRHGHDVASRAYLLHYFVKDKNDPSLEVSFNAHVDRVEIDVNGLERKLTAMATLLNGGYPGHDPECRTCSYQEGRNKLLNGG